MEELSLPGMWGCRWCNLRLDFQPYGIKGYKGLILQYSEMGESDWKTVPSGSLLVFDEGCRNYRPGIS